MYKFLFGLVPSRKLGISPGTDLVQHKNGPSNRVYCDCGRTTKLITERKVYAVLADVNRKITNFSSKKQLLKSTPAKTILRKSTGNIINIISHVNSLQIKI